MKHAVRLVLATVRDQLLEANASPSRLAGVVCQLCMDLGSARAARLQWSPGFAATLAGSGESTEPVAVGDIDDAQSASVCDLGSGLEGRYSLRVALAEPDQGSMVALAAIAAGLDAFLEAWQNNQALQASLQRAEQERSHFQRLFDTVPVSTAIVAKDRTILDVNQAFCDRYGLVRHRAIGHTLSELGFGLLDEDRQQLSEQLIAHRRARNMNLRGLRRDGSIGQVLVNAEMVTFDGVDRVLISSMDITDMLAAAAANAARMHAEADSQAKGEMLARIAAEKAESDRLRALADEAHTSLQRLSEFGRQVTASLDPERIVAALRSKLPTLMPAHGVRVFVLEADDRLQTIGDRGAAAWLDDADEPHLRDLRRCLDAHAVVTLERSDDAPVWPHAPEGARCALVAPLVEQQGRIGLLVVYSRDPAGYGATHCTLLESLTLHVAGAISNSRAYARLKIAQQQLVEREKMAALGSIVAGVAHELNTPIGNALLLASTLSARVNELPADALSPEQARHSLDELRPLALQVSQLIERSLRSAAHLVSSFKQVAADQTADRRRHFDLAEAVDELAATMRNQLQPDHHELVLDIAPGIAMDSYPGALIQVLTNLMRNALQHGLEGRTHGRITIVALPLRKDSVLIEFSDSGCGISDAHLRRVFEPFFTTRLGSGGTGLGLSISYNIVTAVLGGSIQVDSQAGGGARFQLLLPRIAPVTTAVRPPPSAG